MLGGKKVLVEGPLQTMLDFDEPWVKSYFHGKRARTIVRDEPADASDEKAG